tara:strand:- start:373 stop:1137 length:765 start_codon:yes stop_codon:yes gene_type:complete
MVIISLTTIPPRFKYLSLSIESILNQTIKPDKIVIHIPEIYNNFSYENENLPQFLSDKVIYNRQTKDYGPATKLLGLYNTELYNNMSNDDIIIVIDDDRIYNNKLIETFLKFSKKNITKVLTVAGWDIETLTKNKYKINNKKQPRGIEFAREGYIDILGGCCGFLITKRNCPFNYKEIFETNSNDEKYYVDDVFISGFLTLNNIDIYLIPNAKYNDESRNNNNNIHALSANPACQLKRNIKCIEYFINKYNIWN